MCAGIGKRIKKGLKMSVYKRLHLMKSLFKATIVFMLLACALCYQIGYQRGGAKIQEQCETICVD